ncbi:hypothetical protein [Hyphobacterium sp.]|uniref:hypothetical protein n=1 Tax=Hyphobacterium sp. TaxID=2004662 RepID=UPI003748B8E2
MSERPTRVQADPENRAGSAAPDLERQPDELGGNYIGVIDLPANDTANPAFLIANDDRGWRLARTGTR